MTDMSTRFCIALTRCYRAERSLTWLQLFFVAAYGDENQSGTLCRYADGEWYARTKFVACILREYNRHILVAFRVKYDFYAFSLLQPFLYIIHGSSRICRTLLVC